MVEDALERMAAEVEWQLEQDAEQSRRRAYAQGGGSTLGDDFPDMDA